MSINGIPDVEPKIFEECSRAVLDINPTVRISDIEIQEVSQLPFVSICETQNRVHEESSASGMQENHAQLEYTVQVYCSGENRKMECKEIVNTICSYFGELGFYRTDCGPMEYKADPDVYRMTGIFEAVIDANMNIYRPQTDY